MSLPSLALLNDRRLVPLLLLIALAISYGHTLDVPFYLDDHSSIVENPIIQRGDVGEIVQFSPLRTVGYLTFVFNYRINALDPAGYHLVNLAIHWLVALVVWGLAASLLRAPRIAASLSPAGFSSSGVVLQKGYFSHSGTALPATPWQWLPLFAALLFLLHPLHTGAVTYIVQRLASLTALGYLLAIFAYVQLRLSRRPLAIGGWILVGLVAATAALLTKQNSVTLPLAIWLVELVAFAPRRRLFLAWSLVAVLAGVMAWAVMVYYFQFQSLSLSHIDSRTRETAEFGRDVYLYTQMDVLWRYLGLFFYPVGLHLDRHIELLRSPTEIRVIFGAVGHLVLIAGSLLLIRRLPLITIGVTLWYVAQMVESGIIPIRDVMFEHRTYLPDAGLVLALSAAVFSVGQRLGNRAWRLLGPAMVISLVVLAVLTWQRNQVWRDPTSLWLDNTVQSPERQRPWIELGKYYMKQDRNEEAAEVLIQATRLQNDQPVYSPALPINLSIALRRIGRIEEARSVIEEGLTHITDDLNRGKLLAALGMIHATQGEFDAAERNFRAALDSYPYLTNVLFNLSLIEIQRDQVDQAELLLKRALAVDPDHAQAIDMLRRIRQVREGGSS